ncbi:response regulator [Psychromicrobium sp. YIM B11713]|uniref:response regulator n=1 Tax=Psychromicrobium sp. YIM B11713 TaxID=3145233 RepID=UPI00374FACC5
MTEPIRLLIADDQTVVREALEVMLDLEDGMEVVGTAENGLRATELAVELRPDVVLMDINMPLLDGIRATEKILREIPGTAIMMLTTFDDEESILASLRAGALGYLTKDADRERIVQAIRSAALGQSVLDAQVQLRLLQLVARVPAPEGDPVSLTLREEEILGLIGLGLRNAEIADRLVISEATVKTHINNLFAKADLHSRAEAVRYALGRPSRHRQERP